MKTINILLLSFIILACSSGNPPQTEVAEAQTTEAVTPEVSENTAGDSLQTAYFASGCFWCVEAIFESVRGVEEAVSGYAGGDSPNPTYDQVSAGLTDHAEAVQVFYDSTQVSYSTLLEVYYASHNPTTVNGQAPDFGKQYRSMILYQNDREGKLARAFADSLNQSGLYERAIVTEIVQLKTFWPAEEYHQDYERKNPDNPYVQKVSIPRLNAFKAKMPEVLKEDAKLSH